VDAILSGYARKVFKTGAHAVIKGLALNRANRLTCAFLEEVSPLYEVHENGVQLVFYCPNLCTRWRAESLFTKEPETIEWIDTFKKGEILFDIGANVGVYSIYAGARGAEVFAFEPESQNYALINRNIYVNHLSNTVRCLNIALSDKNGIDYLYLARFEAGGALNNFGEKVDLDHRPFEPSFQQGGVSFSLDSLVERPGIPLPNHIKIDVDGIEFKIVQGARRTLANEVVKSVSIELNEHLAETREVIECLSGAGLKMQHKKHALMFDGGPYAHIYNYLFVRG
jgi:FkbM family methyltransferase